MSFETFKNSQMFKRKSVNLLKLGFNFENDTLEEYEKIQLLLFTEYHINSGSMITIMKKFGIPSSRTMDILFREFDINSRDLSESTILSIEQDRSDPVKNISKFQHIWHKTWDGKNVLLRSSHEKNLADILDTEKLGYEVECMRIRYKDENDCYRIAVPDFYVPSQHKIIEVKSTYWLNEQNMLMKKKAYNDLGYNFSLFLDGVFYDDWWVLRDSNPSMSA